MATNRGQKTYTMQTKISLLLLACLLCTVGSYAQPGASLQRGLVAHYGFNASTKDKSGNNNHGYMTGGVDYDYDRFNNKCSAMRFDGSGYITVPSSASLKTPRNALTVATWINVQRSPGKSLAWLTVCCKGDLIDERNNSPQYRMQSTSVTVSVNTDFTEPAELNINYGQWYHYALVYNGNEVRTFLNGNEVFSYPYYETFAANDRPLEIGRDMPGEIEYFVGVMDELRIYNRALTDSEVLELFYDDRDRNKKDVLCPGDTPEEPIEEPEEPIEEPEEPTEEPEEPRQPEVIEVVRTDTVYVPRRDTVFVPVRDTVVIERRDTVYVEPDTPINQDQPVNPNGTDDPGNPENPVDPSGPDTGLEEEDPYLGNSGGKPTDPLKSLPKNLKDGQINVGDHYVLDAINFQQSTPIILPGSYEELDKVVDLMKAYPNMEIVLEGHTDAVGSGKKNMRLSKERVATVKTYIVRNAGIKSKRIQTKAFGESKPIAPNHNEKNRKKNRRVEMTITKI